jgi:disulfide bond formation protein DsbB
MFASRAFQICILIAIVVIFAIAMTLEYTAGLKACPLCIFQRIAYGAIGIGAFIALLGYHCRHARTTGWLVGLIFSLAGLGLAVRQCWLQHLGAAAVTNCLPGLHYMYSNFSWFKATMLVFQGTTDCATVTWRFLGLSLAGWSVIAFIGFVIIFLTALIENSKAGSLGSKD